MATRSHIGKKQSDGTIKYIYCHWDGYPEYNGEILKNHYTDEAKIDALLELGDISSLNEEIGEKHDFNDHDLRVENKWVCSYKRDRDESDTEARIANDVTELTQSSNWTEYHYVYDNGKWRCWGSNGHEIVF